MKKFLFALTLLVSCFIATNFAQEKTLIADGTADLPIKYDLEPTVEKLSSVEIKAVKKAVLEKEVSFQPNYNAMSAEESNFKQDFELLDVAEGFFIYREIQFRAYLYTVYSQKMSRNYQGIIVLRILENGAKFDVATHYVYEYHGDKYLRQLRSLKGDTLDELAIFSEPPTKKGIRKLVRIIEFSPNGLQKIGLYEIYNRENRPNYIPKDPKQKQLVQTPLISAVKLFAEIQLGKQPEFYEERWRKTSNFWGLHEKLQYKPITLAEDTTNYVELFKPIFPKGIGEN